MTGTTQKRAGSVRCTAIVATACLLALVSLSEAAWSNELDVRIDTHKAAADEFFEITVVYTGEEEAQLSPPNLEKFSVEQPSHRCGTSIQCVNTNCSASKNCTVLYRLFPKRTGRLTIPPFKLVRAVKSGQLQTLAQSKPITIQVTAAGTGKKRKSVRQGRRSRRPGTQRKLESRKARRRQARIPTDKSATYESTDLQSLERFGQYDLFIVPVLRRPWAFVNQPFVVDFVLFVNAEKDSPVQEIDVRQMGLELHEVVGFGKEEVEHSNEQAEVTIGSNKYASVVAERYIYTPMSPGTNALPGGTAHVAGVVEVTDPFWGPTRRRHRFTLAVPQITMPVRDVPAQRPAGFDMGNIGNFAISNLELPQAQPAGSWMMLKYTVEGTGNLFSVAPPGIDNVPDLSQRPVHVDRSQVVRDHEGLSGIVKVQIPIRLERAGKHQLPPLKLVWFDPETEQFEAQTVTIPAITTTRPVAANGNTPALLSEELEGIITDGDFSTVPATGSLLSFWWILGWAILVPLSWLLCLLFTAVFRFMTRDTSRRRVRLAFQASRLSLQEAEEAMKAGRNGEFFAAIAKALGSALDGGFGISIGSTTQDGVHSNLVRQGASADLADKVRTELENAEFARFAPSAVKTEDLKETMSRSNQLVHLLERASIGSGRSANRAVRSLAILAALLVALGGAGTRHAHAAGDAPDDAELYSQGNQAYLDGQYETAKDQYQALLTRLPHQHPALLFNLGNCAYKLGRLGLATYYYRLTESSDGEVGRRAAANLRLTRSALLEKYKSRMEKGQVRYDESHGLWYALANLLSTTVSGSLFLLFSALLFAGMYMWAFARRNTRSALGRLLTLSFLAPALLSGALYFGAEGMARTYSFGIVVAQDARILDSPSEEAPGDPLPEGLEVRLLMHNEAGYFKVRLSDGKVGYAPDNEVWSLQP